MKTGMSTSGLATQRGIERSCNGNTSYDTAGIVILDLQVAMAHLLTVMSRSSSSLAHKS